MFMPHLDQFRGTGGFAVKTKIQVVTKLTVVMCFQIFYLRSEVPSSKCFRWRPVAAKGLFTEPQTAV